MGFGDVRGWRCKSYLCVLFLIYEKIVFFLKVIFMFIWLILFEIFFLNMIGIILFYILNVRCRLVFCFFMGICVLKLFCSICY